MKKKVIKIIREILEENGLDSSVVTKINENSILTEHLGLDSFNLAQLTVEIESEFGVDIFENGIISTFGDILNQLK
jgi:acyl carrier protein